MTSNMASQAKKRAVGNGVQRTLAAAGQREEEEEEDEVEDEEEDDEDSDEEDAPNPLETGGPRGFRGLVG